jgi:hypothetical protein
MNSPVWLAPLGELPEWWARVTPRLREWLLARDSVDLCECDDVRWRVNDDPTTAIRCQRCGLLRPSEKCALPAYEGHFAGAYRCRSTDKRHLKRAVQWLEYDSRALKMAYELSVLQEEPVDQSRR